MREMQNLIIGNDPPKTEFYAMECKLKASRHEQLGNGEVTTSVEFDGFASTDVVNAMLDMMKGVVSA